MVTWSVTTLILCTYGFFKEVRPSEEYLTEYLTGPWKNLTLESVYQEVYPVWTYSYLGLLVLVFLLTDILRYKPVIVFEGFSFIGTWCLLLWAQGVPAMQGMQFLYGIASSTEVAYYSYIYAQVPKEKFQKVTSYTRTAILVGKFLQGVLSQVLISTGAMDYHSLNYISLASVCVASLFSFILPPVTTSIYFHKRNDDVLDDENEDKETKEVEKPKVNGYLKGYLQLLRDLRIPFTNPLIVKWSIWWAFATCGNFQVGNYIQPLWETVDTRDEEEGAKYNGAVGAVSTLLGATSSFAVGYLHMNWDHFGEAVLFILTAIEGAILYTASQVSNVWGAYVCYALFRMSYQMLITIVSYQVAKLLKRDSYGLIFGANTFFALALQTILTVIVVEDKGLGLDPRAQFQVYGGYFFVLGGVFLVFWIMTIKKSGFC